MNIKCLTFIIFCFIFSNQQKIINKQKKIVNLAFAINNKFVNLLFISLYSLLENSDNNTIYNIFIQVKNNIVKEREKSIYNLEKKFFNCFIHFINMKREFINAFRNSLDISTYYRLKLPVLCPNINRIIHIDVDTIVLKDLTELYSLNFEGNYILGRLDKITSELDSLGVYTQTYINAGVLLMDLYSLRKYNYDQKFMDYIYQHNNYKYLWHHAQTTLNYICHDKIGVLRPKYHMWPFYSVEVLISLNNLLRKKYNETEFISDYYDPFIVHFPGRFKKIMNSNSRYHKKFREYSDKIQEIKELKLESVRNIINYIFLTSLIIIKILKKIFRVI